MGTNRNRGKGKVYFEARARLIDKGFGEKNLDALSDAYLNYESQFRPHELERIKKRFSAVIERLRNDARDMEELGKMKLDNFGGMPLAEALSLRLDGERYLPVPAFFEIQPQYVRGCAASLEKLLGHIAENLSVRGAMSPSRLLSQFCLFGRSASNGDISYGDLGAFLSAATNFDKPHSEDQLRVQLKRFEQTEPDLYRRLEAAIRDYINAVPTGQPTFLEWQGKRIRYSPLTEKQQ